MRSDYPQWLAAQKYAANTQAAQIHRIKKVSAQKLNDNGHRIRGMSTGRGIHSAYPSPEKSTRQRLAEAPIEGPDP